MAARTGRQNTYYTTRNTSGYRNPYVYGNAVRELELPDEQERRESQRRRQKNIARKNREKAKHMSLGYVLFLMAALCVAVFVLISYVQVQAEITTLNETISGQQKELNSLRVSNDEAYNRILSSVDLEEIKRIAIGELGMVYPEEGQIISYSNVGNDYVRKVNE